jgi:hypothetical protein
MCNIVAQPIVIFDDGTKNFLDNDVLVGALRNREARHRSFCVVTSLFRFHLRQPDDRTKPR